MGGKYFIFRSQFLGLVILLSAYTLSLSAQNEIPFFSDSTSLSECIKYAFQNQPTLKQLKLDERIIRQDIRISLSGWFPQINTTAGVQHYLKQPVAMFPNFSDLTGPKIPVKSGLVNNSDVMFSLSQNIFTNELYFAGRTSGYVRQQASQSTNKAMIQLVVDVSKAFYDVLLSQQTLKIIDEQIVRLTKSLNDAMLLYKNGTTDRIDYSRATISLNNTKSQKIYLMNTIKAKLSYLKQLLGYPEDKPLNLKYNFDIMKNEIMIDTLQGIRYINRVEYQLSQTALQLQQLSVRYYRQNFLPTLSGFANYNFIYQNDKCSQLYDKSYQNSAIGLTLSFPVFEGAKRLQSLRKSRLLYERMALDTAKIHNEINTQYTQALASYKSNLAAYKMTLENIGIARDVYSTVMLQYNQGVKSYLEVIISETDLQSSQVDNLSALISLMFSKIDVQQATGTISVKY